MSMQQKCPRCKTVWPEDTRNCPDCGERTMFVMSDQDNPILAIFTMPVPRVKKGLIGLVVAVFAAAAFLGTQGASAIDVLVAGFIVLAGIAGVGVGAYLDLRAFMSGDVDEE